MTCYNFSKITHVLFTGVCLLQILLDIVLCNRNGDENIEKVNMKDASRGVVVVVERQHDKSGNDRHVWRLVESICSTSSEQVGILIVWRGTLPHTFKKEVTGYFNRCHSKTPQRYLSWRSDTQHRAYSWLPLSPFDLTIALEIETQVCQDLYRTFDILEIFDIAFPHLSDRGKCSNGSLLVPEAFPTPDLSVVLYRNSFSVHHAFQLLTTASVDLPLQARRQLLLLESESNLRVGTLPPEYAAGLFTDGESYGAIVIHPNSSKSCIEKRL